jgi:hypothetical protein
MDTLYIHECKHCGVNGYSKKTFAPIFLKQYSMQHREIISSVWEISDPRLAAFGSERERV